MILAREQLLVLLVVILSLLVDIGDVAVVVGMVGLLPTVGLMVVLDRLLAAAVAEEAHQEAGWVTPEETAVLVALVWCY
jgi:hypothetical protein